MFEVSLVFVVVIATVLSNTKTTDGKSYEHMTKNIVSQSVIGPSWTNNTKDIVNFDYEFDDDTDDIMKEVDTDLNQEGEESYLNQQMEKEDQTNERASTMRVENFDLVGNNLLTEQIQSDFHQK